LEIFGNILCDVCMDLIDWYGNPNKEFADGRSCTALLTETFFGCNTLREVELILFAANCAIAFNIVDVCFC
jgi:hypothetical protein